MNRNMRAKTSILKQVFDGYIEDSVTDEQVHRALAPVLKLIREGVFDRRRSIFGLIRRRKNAAL